MIDRFSSRVRCRTLLLLFLLPSAASLLIVGPAVGQADAPVLTTPAPDVASLASTPLSAAAPTATYTLPQALGAAFHTPLTSLRWQVSQDRAQQAVSLARANFQPVFSTSTTVHLLTAQDLVSYSADQGGFTGERFRVGLNVAYPLYDAGQRVDELHIAQAGVAETQAALRGEKMILLQDVVQTFYDVLQQQRLMETAQLQLASQRQNLSAATTRYALGTVTKGDVLSAQSALASSVADADQRSLALTQARAHLAILLGGDPIKIVPAVAAPEAGPKLLLSLDQLLTRILQHDPTRARLLAQKIATRAQLSVIRAEATPSVELRASGGYVDQDHTSSSRGSRPYSYVLLNLNIPILSKQRDRARERSQIDSVELLDLSIQQNEYDIRERVLAAYTAYQVSLAQVESAGAALSAATEAQRLVQEQYAVGTATQSAVQSAILRLTEARDRYDEALDARDKPAQRLTWMAVLDPSFPVTSPASPAATPPPAPATPAPAPAAP